MRLFLAAVPARQRSRSCCGRFSSRAFWQLLSGWGSIIWWSPRPSALKTSPSCRLSPENIDAIEGGPAARPLCLQPVQNKKKQGPLSWPCFLSLPSYRAHTGFGPVGQRLLPKPGPRILRCSLFVVGNIQTHFHHVTLFSLIFCPQTNIFGMIFCQFHSTYFARPSKRRKAANQPIV